MGSAIECFDDAGAVVVPRERFAPVKTCGDLFILRSDAYKVKLAYLAAFSCTCNKSGHMLLLESAISDYSRRRVCCLDTAHKIPDCNRKAKG